MTSASQAQNFALEGNDETQKKDAKNQKGAKKVRPNQSSQKKDADIRLVNAFSEEKNLLKPTDRKFHEPLKAVDRKSYKALGEVPEPLDRKSHEALEFVDGEILKITNRKSHVVLESTDPKSHVTFGNVLGLSDRKSHVALESVDPELHETFIAEHNYGAETIDKKVKSGFTQPCSPMKSAKSEIREIRRSLDEKRVKSGWNYANPMERYVELCSDDSKRCFTEIEEVLEKYFTVSGLTTTSTNQRSPVERCKVNEPMETEEIIDESVEQASGPGNEDSVSGNVEICKSQCPPPGDGSQCPKKVSPIGVDFLQDKRVLLLKTPHSARKTARERYQHLTKGFRLPGKVTGSNLGLNGSCRRISRFLNDECWTEANGRRETCIVTQNVSRTNHFVDASCNTSEAGENKQNTQSSSRSSIESSSNDREEKQNDSVSRILK